MMAISAASPLRVFLIVFFVFSGWSLQAGPWPIGKYKSFIKAGYSYIEASDYFDQKGKVISGPKTTLGIIELYGEVGISSRLTAMVYAPLLVQRTLDASAFGNKQEVSGLGDPDLALRYLIGQRGPWFYSATLGVSLPLGSAHHTDLNTGDGEWTPFARLEAGTSGRRWWAAAGLGFNNRTMGFSDEWVASLEGGYQIIPDKLLFIVRMDHLQSLNNGNTATPSFFYYRENNTGYSGLAPEVLWYVHPAWAIQGRLGLAPFGARNIQAAPMVSFGLCWHRK